MENKIAIAYLRVSTERQSEEGSSIESQREHAKDFAQRNGLQLEEHNIFTESRPASKVYDDRYDVEDSILKRPQLQRIINLIEQNKAQRNKIGYLIVYTRDRLTRNVVEYYYLKQLFEKHDIAICYSKPGEYFSNPFEKQRGRKNKDQYIEGLIEVVLSSIAELESNILSSRVKVGNGYCIELGYWPGGAPPFGYRLKEEKMPARKRPNSLLKPIPYEGEIVREIFELYNNYGLGYRKIANFMNEKYPFKEWTKSSIETIIKNEIYRGKLIWNRRGGRRNPGRHDVSEYKIKTIDELEIIDEIMWERTTLFREEKTIIRNPHYFSTPFLLYEKLFCGICGEKMKGKNYGRNKNNVYRCINKSIEDTSELIVNQKQLEEHFIKQLRYCIEVENIDVLWNLYNERYENEIKRLNESKASHEDKIEAYEKQLGEVKTALSVFVN